MNLFPWDEFTTYRFSQGFKRFLAGFAIYISIAGLVTFSQFILEESFQTVMFGTWPAQDAKRWEVVLEGTDLMEHIVDAMNVVNYTLGWIQPLALLSYGAYAKSATYYIKALRSKILAHAPGIMVGRKISMKFTVRTITKNNGEFLMHSGNIYFKAKKRIKGTFNITGTLTQTEVGYELTGIPKGALP